MQNVNRGHSTRRAVHGKKPVGKVKFAVSTVRVDPVLWRELFTLAPHASVYDVLAINPTTVIVCNSREHRDYMRKLYGNG